MLKIAVLIAAILSAAISWGLGETPLMHFRPQIANVSMMGTNYRDSSPQTKEIATLKQASCILGCFGALLAGSVGAAGGYLAGSRKSALMAASAGLLVGGLAGALPPWLVIPLYNRAEELTPGELGRSLLMHWSLWLALGAATGLALGLSMRNSSRLLRAVFGGMIGVALGTLVFELIGGLLFPLAETGKPLAATWETRLLSLLTIATYAAMGAVVLATIELSPRRKPNENPH
jgi:hypothetical protein